MRWRWGGKEIIFKKGTELIRIPTFVFEVSYTLDRFVKIRYNRYREK